jgi:lambda family phage portal protein
MTVRKAKPGPPGKHSSQARYDAAGQGRRIAHWNPGSHGPNRAIDGLQRVRDRARDSSRNDWAGESGIQKWVTNLVGVGITPRWKNERIQELWLKSQGEMDADGVSDFYAQTALAVRTWLDGGEAFIRRRPRNPLTSPLAVPLQAQLIEGDFVPLFDALQWQGMPLGNEIVQGVERNRFGERVAYWIYKSHPGDKPQGGQPNPLDLVRVPARDLSHVFEPRRPGQMRGVSMLAPVLIRLRNAMDLEDVVLDRQKLANLFTMFITRQLPEEWDGLEFDELTGLPKFYSKDGTPMAGLEPGIAQELRPGEDVKFGNPPEAGTTYSEYMRTSHMGTAAGAGLPYEFMAGDIRDTSDRTLRIMVNEFRRFAEQRQWHVVIPKICQPPVKWWAEAAVLAGKLTLAELEEAQNPEWTPHGWPDIHPTQDIEGRIKARDAGFTSTTAIIARGGEDPKKVLAQIKADKESGLTPPDPAAQAPVAAPAPGGVEAALSSIAALVATQGALLALAQSLADKPSPQPQPLPVPTHLNSGGSNAVHPA